MKKRKKKRKEKIELARTARLDGSESSNVQKSAWGD
jgi:hypothetical protein